MSCKLYLPCSFSRFLIIFVPSHSSPISSDKYPARKHVEVCRTVLTFWITTVSNSFTTELLEGFPVKCIKLWLPSSDKHQFVVFCPLNVISKHFRYFYCLYRFWCVWNVPDKNLSSDSARCYIFVRMVVTSIVNFILMCIQSCPYWTFFRIPNLYCLVRASW